MSVTGHDLANIVTLRTVDDAQQIAQQSEGKDVVIAGASFIGQSNISRCLAVSHTHVQPRGT